MKMNERCDELKMRKRVTVYRLWITTSEDLNSTLTDWRFVKSFSSSF